MNKPGARILTKEEILSVLNNFSNNNMRTHYKTMYKWLIGEAKEVLWEYAFQTAPAYTIDTDDTDKRVQATDDYVASFSDQELLEEILELVKTGELSV